MVQDVIKQVEQIRSEKYGELKEELSQSAPNAVISFYSHTVGSLTDYQGHDVVIDCFLKNTPPQKSDNVALIIGFCYITSNPKLNADVVWGHPSGHCEAETFSDWLCCSDWPEVSEKNVEILYKDIPRLCKVFKEAIIRGYPSE